MLWRDIAGFPEYEVSDSGAVRKGGRLLQPATLGNGYQKVTLFRDGVRHQKLVHRLVLEAFVGPCPPGCETRHGDGNRANNRLGNLCWGTKRENMEDQRRHGTRVMRERHPQARLTGEQVEKMRGMWAAGGLSAKALGARFGVSESQTFRIVKGEAWVR